MIDGYILFLKLKQKIKHSVESAKGKDIAIVEETESKNRAI